MRLNYENPIRRVRIHPKHTRHRLIYPIRRRVIEIKVIILAIFVHDELFHLVLNRYVPAKQVPIQSKTRNAFDSWRSIGDMIGLLQTPRFKGDKVIILIIVGAVVAGIE